MTYSRQNILLITNLKVSWDCFPPLRLLLPASACLVYRYSRSNAGLKRSAFEKFSAHVSQIVFMLTEDLTKWIILANIIAWPLAYYYINKWIQDFAYRINLTIWPFLFSGLLALLIALLTVSWQTIRAARANPVDSLRYE